MYVETVGTGTYQYECYRNLDNPRTVTGFTSYQAALDAVAAHRQECEECVFGCCVSETQDLPDAPNVSFANMNAKAVFDFIGVSLDGYGDGDWCGTIGADSLLAACHIALATGAPVLHSRPSSIDARAGATMVDCGLDEEGVLERVRMLADVATTGVQLGRAIRWD